MKQSQTGWAWLALVWTLHADAANQEVTIPGPGVALQGYFYPAKSESNAKPAPAILMLHGCSGLLDKAGRPTRSYAFWAEHFQALGYHALLLDSFNPRGSREICTHQKRAINPSQERSRDAHAALAWLATHKQIDPQRIHILGWSNGAMTVLHAIKPDAAGRDPKQPTFRSAVAFYPGCVAVLKSEDYRALSPLLIQSGLADDWTPAEHCQSLAARLARSEPPVTIDVYPDAHHGFDRLDIKLRYRPEVRNPNSPGGWGATVGTNEAARKQAIARVTEYIQQQSR